MLDTMSTSCPGFLDRYGIWNNGFDCSSPRICCGTDNDRYCCILSPPTSSSPSSSSFSTSYQSFDDLNTYSIHTSNNFLSEKWYFIQMCTIGILLAIILLIFIIIYLCLTSMRQKTKSIIQIPLPTTTSSSSQVYEPKRSVSNRISTISSTSSDVKSRCTDTSIILNTPLNRYPTTNSRNSTTSSYYIYPNEFEYLCE